MDETSLLAVLCCLSVSHTVRLQLFLVFSSTIRLAARDPLFWMRVKSGREQRRRQVKSGSSL